MSDEVDRLRADLLAAHRVLDALVRAARERQRPEAPTSFAVSQEEQAATRRHLDEMAKRSEAKRAKMTVWTPEKRRVLALRAAREWASRVPGSFPSDV